MSSVSSLLSEEQFLCSICLKVFTDPVTTPCGHNYCKTCITKYWDSSEVYRCPLCKATFYTRPDVSVNTFISGLADQIRNSKQLKNNSITNQEPVEPDEISCDVCTGPKLKALKSCLVCMTSYCETHLELHQKVTAIKQHTLIEPVKKLEDITCKKHDRPMELFCKTDHTCICQLCTELDHKLHQIVSVKEAYEGKKAEARKTEAEVQQMIEERQLKIQEFKLALELSKKEADRELADSVKVFTALISCIERSRAEFFDVIEEKQKQICKQAEGYIKELQQEITELKTRSFELKQLSYTEDQLHLLRNFPSINIPLQTKDWTKVNVHRSSYVGTLRTAVAQLEKTLSNEMKPDDAELSKIQEYAVDVTLDPDTAECNLILSADGKQVKHGDIKKNLPDNKERFAPCTCVLGKQGFSSGRFYYEVQVKGKTDWDLGVARESIKRKGSITLSPNHGYWTTCMRNGNQYMALASPAVLLPVKEKIQKVGVFVDYEDCLVSFYDVEARAHLYTFTGCTFTEKLYPFFCPSLNKNGTNSAAMIIS